MEPWARVVDVGSGRGIGARAKKLGVQVQKAGTQAVELRIRAGKPEALAVKQWPWMVRPVARALQP